MPLTDTAIKALKPKATRYKVFDGGGLYLEVLPTGSKVWRIKYREAGKDRRHTIGHYPAVSLRDARLALLNAKALLASGERLEPDAKAQNPTFSATALEWIERQAPRWSEAHKTTVTTRLQKYAFPHIGGNEIQAVTPQEILKFLRLIEGRGTFETASRVLGICSQVFRYGVACGYCGSDPCRDLRGALTAHMEKPRAALIRPGDVAGLMASIMEYRGNLITRAAMLWSAYTFCRPGEVRRAEWQEIDWEGREWRIPAHKMKMRFEHRVPLARQCVALLEGIRERKLSEQWIFPGVRPSRPLSENGVLSALRRMGYGKDEMTAHGFRAMASTLLNEMGYRPDLIERQLAHGDTDKVRAVYNRAAYMDERRAMMQAWADYLDSLAQGQSRLHAPDIPE
ncbi:tyrosine-type recombinase/integrase [Desulfovibrio sp. ZJ200]|uniref:tyrosine-type recombinase/integrase n=1 Tax=Desulfovibrio sp. ZJ200 TaxID=2709792 RepID=UPI0013ED9F71|nr:tyrosine-type recombinase/integrase [Desulfovibrio sp. ZJ200]